MKKPKIFLILVLIIVFYSCKEGKTQEVDKTNVVNQTEVDAKNTDCVYLEQEIGKNREKLQVKLIGLFENLKNNGEHTYGYTLMLWKLNNEILGFLDIYEGGIEPNRSGPITLGKLTDDNLKFKVWTKQSKAFGDWQQSDVNIFSFTGTKSKNKIIGGFSMFNCSNGEIQKNYDEKIELTSSNIWELKSFENIKEWKEEYSYSLNYDN